MAFLLPPSLGLWLPPDRTGWMSHPGERNLAFFPWGLPLPALGRGSCPESLRLADGPRLPLPSMLTWPEPDPGQSSHRIALPPGAWVNVCTLGCHRNTFLCKVEKSKVSFLPKGWDVEGPGPAQAVGPGMGFVVGRGWWVGFQPSPEGRSTADWGQVADRLGWSTCFASADTPHPGARTLRVQLATDQQGPCQDAEWLSHGRDQG